MLLPVDVAFEVFLAPKVISGVLKGIKNIPKVKKAVQGIIKVFKESKATRQVAGKVVKKLGKKSVGKTRLVTRKQAFRQAKRDARIPVSKQPEKVGIEYMRSAPHDGGHVIKDATGKPIKTKEYYYKNKKGDTIIIQDHSAGHVKGNQGAHFNIRLSNNPRTGKAPGTQGHYSFDK